MLLVAPVTLSVAKSVEMNAAPLLMTEVLFSNIGGTATQIGDPPNLIIGNVLSDHLGFMDFIYHLTPAVILVMAVASVYCIFVFRSHVKDPYDPANLTCVFFFFFLSNTMCSLPLVPTHPIPKKKKVAEWNVMAVATGD